MQRPALEGQRVSRTSSQAIGASIAAESNRAWNLGQLGPSWVEPRQKRLSSKVALLRRLAVAGLILSFFSSAVARADVLPAANLMSPASWFYAYSRFNLDDPLQRRR